MDSFYRMTKYIDEPTTTMNPATGVLMEITALTLLQMTRLPREVFVRQETMPARHFFPPHHHHWHQLLYATSGVLVVTIPGERFFIPPEKALWLPAGLEHSVYSEFGTDLKSLYVDQTYTGMMHNEEVSGGPSVQIRVSPLLRELILEASGFAVEYPLQGYEQDVMQLLLQTLARQQRDADHLPWPTDPGLVELCNQLYLQPGDRTSIAELASRLSWSERTLERRFRQQTSMSLREWKYKLRLLKAIELLATDINITHVALELGYNSPSPFIQMFREHMGMTPARYRKRLRGQD